MLDSEQHRRQKKDGGSERGSERSDRSRRKKANYPPEEIRQHIQYGLVEPAEGMNGDIPYKEVRTKEEEDDRYFVSSNRPQYQPRPASASVIASVFASGNSDGNQAQPHASVSFASSATILQQQQFMHCGPY